MYLCMYVYVCTCVCVCMCSMYVLFDVCKYVCMYLCMYVACVRMYASMYVCCMCTYVCMCMYVCMCVFFNFYRVCYASFFCHSVVEGGAGSDSFFGVDVAFKLEIMIIIINMKLKHKA